MKSEEALEFIDKLFIEKNQQVCSDLEKTLFLNIWEGESFNNMFIPGYSQEHLRATASKLYKKIENISDYGIKVKKQTMRRAVEFLYKNLQKAPSSDQTGRNYAYLPQENKSSLQQNNNPFVPLVGIVEPQLFFGREREIQRIFELLNAGSSVAIIGEEGTGKSSLLSLICQQANTYLEKPRTSVFLDLDNGVHNQDEFYTAFCDKISIPKTSGYMLTKELQDKRLLVVMDNIGILMGEGFASVRSHLRGLANSNVAPLRLVLSANEPLDKLFKDSSNNSKTSPLEGICQQENIKHWDETVIREFIISRLDKTSVRFTDDEIIKLIQKSGGHPRNLMKLCYETYSRYI